MRSKFRIGLAGVGPHMMEHLLPALWLIPGVEIVSAVSSSPVKQKKMNQKLWIPTWFCSIEALIHANICDGIVASGSVDYHERVLSACISSNLPVFVEKPPAMNLSTLSALSQAAQKKGVVIGVGLNLPHTEIIWRAAKFVDDCKTSVKSIKINYHTNKPRFPLWNLDSLMQSFLLAIAVHPLSLAQHFLGRNMSCSDIRVQAKGDSITLRISLESDGRLAEVVSSNNAKNHICDFELELASGGRLNANGLKSLV